MKVRDEIKAYAKKEDRSALDWLLDRYHWESQWRFVAACTFVRHGAHSYQLHRVWAPTPEGWILYKNRGESK